VKIPLVALACALLASPASLLAGTIYVDDDNTGGPWDGSPANPYQYIQDGITNAIRGGTVLVRDGTYTGALNRNLDFSGKEITLVSEHGASSTIIDCEHVDRGFFFHSGEMPAAVVDGFTITNGSADYGAAVACWYNSNPQIKNCTMTGNDANHEGGGIDCWNSSPTITGCTITSNTADEGGGGINCYLGSPTLVGGAAAGREVNARSDECSPTIAHCTISWNTAYGLDAPTYSGGGAIHCDASTPTIEHCTMRGNTSAYYGGGIECRNGALPGISVCTFDTNSAVGGEGGGIASWQSSPTVEDCAFISNASGGGDGGGGIFVWSGPAVIAHCLLLGNTSQAPGGGISITHCGPEIEIRHCSLVNNTATAYGGGIYCGGYASPGIHNCLIVGNAVTAQFGGGIEAYFGSHPAITNCTITGNSAPVQGGAISCSGPPDDPSHPTLTNCILWQNTPDEIGLENTSSPIVTCCDVDGGWPGAGNIDDDPLFVTGPLGDYYLSQTAAGQESQSPCVDTGSDTAANLGLDVRTTRTDHLADASTVDMGYHSPRCPGGLPGDVDGNGVVDGLDLTAVLSAWETVPGDPLWNANADLDCNGVVDGLDLTAVISNWTTAVATAPESTATESASPGRREPSRGNARRGPGKVRKQ